MRNILRQSKKGDLPMCKFYQPYHSALRQKSFYSKLAFNKQIFSYIDRMKKTAASYKFLYLVSNQVFSRQSLFVINKDMINNNWIHQSYSNPSSYKAYINPKIEQYLNQKIKCGKNVCQFHMFNLKLKDLKKQKFLIQIKKDKRYNKICLVLNHMFFSIQQIIQLENVFQIGICVKENMRLYYSVEDKFPKTKFVLKDYSMRVRQILSKQKDIQSIKQKPQYKQLQKKNEQTLRNVLQQEINAFCQKYTTQP